MLRPYKISTVLGRYVIRPFRSYILSMIADAN
jgi:hypothetical protein